MTFLALFFPALVWGQTEYEQSSHADVGGAEQEGNNYALEWMLKQANDYGVNVDLHYPRM